MTQPEATEVSLLSAFPSGAPLALLVIGVSTVLAILGAVLAAPNSLTYDEPMYLATVGQLRNNGFGVEFLTGMKVHAGPLYAIVHLLAQPWTGLQAPGVRIVNPMLLAGSVCALGFALAVRGAERPLLSALGVVSIPMVVTTSGLALTEIPAVFFASLALALLLAVMDRPFGAYAAGLAVLGGTSLGLAIAGRQPLILTILPLPLLIVGNGARARLVAVFGASAIVLPTLIFGVWGGPTPPAVAGTIMLAPVHALLGGAYALFALAIIAPRVVVYRPFVLAAALGGGIAVNWFAGVARLLPLATATAMTAPRALLDVGSRIMGGALIGLGVVFLAAMVRHMRRNSQDGVTLYLCASAVALVVSSAFVGHQFSSRYLVPAVPFLIALDRGRDGADWFRSARLLAGSVVGLISLATYLFGAK